MTFFLPQLPLSSLERFLEPLEPLASGSLSPEEQFLRVEAEKSLRFLFWEEWPMELLRVLREV